MDSTDLVIIRETLETVKEALSAVVKAPEMKQARFGLWLRCKEALRDIEMDLEPRLPKTKEEAS